MATTVSLPATKDIVQRFANALKEKDFQVVSSLLSEYGEYEIKNEQLQTVTCDSRTVFIEWIRRELSGTAIEKIEFDQCLLCMVGNPVVLFNDGKFPSVRKHGMDRSMQGLMVNVKEGVIIGTRFCNTFLGRENKTQFECLSPKIDALVASGLSFEDAIRKVSRDEGYPDEALGGFTYRDS